MKKVKIKFKPWIVILAAILLLSTLFGLIMQLRGFTLLFDTSDEFGGETVLAVDFDEPSVENSTSGYVTTLSYGNVCAKVGTFTEGNGSFVYTVPANSVNTGNGSDPYVNFAFDKSKVYLNEFSAYSMDFDIHIIETPVLWPPHAKS